MSEWQSYWAPYRRLQVQPDYPRNHEWIEIKRRGETHGTIVRPRELNPALNVIDLMWRPASSPVIDMAPTPHLETEPAK